jgi:hypothetical protein
MSPAVWGKLILLHCDNITAVVYINHLGGHNPAMNCTMKKIFALCKLLGAQLSAIHLPGLENSCADYLSRLYLQHEWQVAHCTFRNLDCHWGPHSIDHLAMVVNTLLPHFNSWFWEPGSEAIDTTVQNWKGENNWAALPIALIPRVVHLIHEQDTTATLIAPIWPGKPWFQELLAIASDLRNLPSTPNTFTAMLDKLPKPLHNLQWRWAAFRICGANGPLAGPPPR